MTSCAFIFNFEHILHFIDIAEFKEINAGLA